MMKVAVAAVLLIASCLPAFSCESGHWVQETLADGQIIKLEDGTIWKVASFDALSSSLWLATDEVVVCDDKLIHVEDGEQVQARQIR